MEPDARYLAQNLLAAPSAPVAEETEKHQEQVKEERSLAAESRAARPLLNEHTYPELYEKWKKTGGKLPKCNRCKATIHFGEPAHVCPGYLPAAHGAAFRRDGTFKDMSLNERSEYRRSGWDDWDDDQYDPTTPGDADAMRHEAETCETKDQIVIEGMTEEEYLIKKFGYVP
jgi:hypothetical protein